MFQKAYIIERRRSMGKILLGSFIVSFFLVVSSCVTVEQVPAPVVPEKPVEETTAPRFEATGFSFPQQMSREPGVVVRFDTQPTLREFRLYVRMRTENGIGYHNGYAETYYPLTRNPLSFEVSSDREARYARAWIETQSNARIVVRIRAALCDRNYIIAHTDIPSGSPYGEGDWVDEWYHIYPDGVHVRKVKIYTGTAPESQPFGFERFPPKIIHEVQETSIRGVRGHLPEDDVDINALTLIRMNGENTTISWETSYPDNYGEFRNANIQVINLKSKYRPFTVAIPDGVTIQPYNPEGDLPYKFQVWTRDVTLGWGMALGHIINWKHYERTENTLTNIYLTGMTDASDLVAELVPLARSWLQAPELQLSQESESQFSNEGYDQIQRAHVISYKGKGKPSNVEFRIDANEDSPIVNPAFVLKNYGRWWANLKINGETVNRGKDHRQGAEFHHPVGTDIVIWIKYKSTKPITLSISPGAMVL